MKRIVFCGVGALGSNAVVLCRNLEAQLVLVDFDRVESKNCLSQAFVKPSVGKNKAEALKLQLANFWGVKAESFGVRVEETNVATLCGNADLVVDAFDNAKSRRTLSTWARAADKPLVHAAVSADGTFGLVRWDERFVADEEGAPGQATCEGGEHLPLIALVSSTLARTVQDFVAKGTKRDAMIALSGVTVTAE
ncbi:MAG: ThiF family adenylyltransferase [Labilithrix sp.]|nr:ThiF family adenylyltransferase [Labilithrix sp.]MCW5811367.1 ThiF family adenylyltransferase [Labilithrix sp.]